MSAARRRLELMVMLEARNDLAELEKEARDLAYGALREILTRPLSGEIKKGLLTGARSWSFPANSEDEKEQGRVLYCVKTGTITVFAVHVDHDEAYKRARKRAAKYL